MCVQVGTCYKLAAEAHPVWSMIVIRNFGSPDENVSSIFLLFEVNGVNKTGAVRSIECLEPPIDHCKVLGDIPTFVGAGVARVRLSNRAGFNVEFLFEFYDDNVVEIVSGPTPSVGMISGGNEIVVVLLKLTWYH